MSNVFFLSRSIGKVQSSGGLTGMPLYDKFSKSIRQIVDEPTEQEYLRQIWPHYEAPNYSVDKFLDDPSFVNPLRLGMTPFVYEAAIALGLSACAQVRRDNLTMSGTDHFNRLKSTTFDSISGRVVFDNATGTRDPSSIL